MRVRRQLLRTPMIGDHPLHATRQHNPLPPHRECQPRCVSTSCVRFANNGFLKVRCFGCRRGAALRADFEKAIFATAPHLTGEQTLPTVSIRSRAPLARRTLPTASVAKAASGRARPCAASPARGPAWPALRLTPDRPLRPAAQRVLSFPRHARFPHAVAPRFPQQFQPRKAARRSSNGLQMVIQWSPKGLHTVYPGSTEGP